MNKTYRPLGCFRFLLALFVVTQHALFLAPEQVGQILEPMEIGSMAVLIFFAISGFVVTEAVFLFYQGRPVAFLKNRFIRLYPTYILALSLILALDLIFTHLKIGTSIASSSSTESSNFFLVAAANAVAIFPGSKTLLNAIGTTPKIELA